jgi:GR25 family glycosyltransferase involved in LPS biosynthesis
MRERVSIQSLQQLAKYGIDYQPIINEVYEGIPPAENCRRPEHISKDNKPGELYPGAGLGWMTGRHYGCYLAHRNALETIDEENYDYTLIFEADAFIYTGLEEFVDIVHKACFISERDDAYFISFANNPSREKHKIDDHFSQTGANQDLAHCYLIPNRTKGWWMDRLVDCGWDVGDLWYNHVFYHYPMKRYTTNKMYSKQAEGFSLLDLTVKTWS